MARPRAAASAARPPARPADGVALQQAASAQVAWAVPMRGKLSPPHCEFEPVMPQAAEVMARSAVLAKLVVVRAPVGYGKTVFLSHLHQARSQRGQRCLWLTLDDRDASVSSVLYLLDAALQQAGLVDRDRAADADSERLNDPRDGVDRLLATLVQLPEPVALFIDNQGFCHDPQWPALLDRLVFGTGAALRLVLSTADALPIDMTRAKLELGAVEVGTEHLALDPDAIAHLLARAGLHELGADTLQRIHTQTEGWPAAVRLLQVLMRQAPAPLDVLARFNGDDQDMAAVLTRKVLAGFEPELVRFMIEAALLREFSAELAGHATGSPQAAHWVAELLARNVLVFPLDRSRRWLRMHTLLRQHLLAEGRHSLSRERRREVLERAAHWHAEQGDHVSALEAALEAPAWSLASQLLDQVARVVTGDQGRLAQFVTWAEQLLAAGEPLSLEAHAWYVWALCFSLQYERAHRALESLDHRLQDAPPDDRHTPRLRSRLSLLRVVIGIHLDSPQVAHAEAVAWLADTSPRDALAVATVATGAAIGALALDDTTEARRLMRTASGAVERSESAYGHAWVAIGSALIELVEGEPLLADRLLVAARPRAVAALGEDAPVVSTLDLVHARALLDLGRREAARERARRGLAHMADHGVPDTALQGLHACVGLWQGEAEAPFGPLALTAAACRYPPRVQRGLAIAQVRRLLALDQADDAQALASRHLLELPAPDERGGPQVNAHTLARIDLMIARGQAREALAQIEASLKALQHHARPREAIELHLMAMGLHVKANQQRHAVRALTLAILLAARRKLVWPFHERLASVRQVLAAARTKDFGFTQPDELALLQTLMELSEVPPESQRLAPRLAPRPAPSRVAPQVLPTDAAGADNPDAEAVPMAEVGHLTPRELQLLELLSLGLDNQLIAQRVSLSVPTVKWHLYNLYLKLQVKNRAAALAKARSLNLLPR